LLLEKSKKRVDAKPREKNDKSIQEIVKWEGRQVT